MESGDFVKFRKVKVTQNVKMLKFPDFILIFSILLPNFEQIKSVKLKIKFLSVYQHYIKPSP